MLFYPPGAVVAVSPLIATHFGIATDRGTVIANSKRKHCVCEETVEEFSGGWPIRVVGYLGNLGAAEVLNRARSLLGRPYDLLGFNCEHFVRQTHGLKPKSSQIRTALVLGVAVAVAAFLARR